MTRSDRWLEDKPQVSVGGLLEQESNFLEVVQFWGRVPGSSTRLRSWQGTARLSQHKSRRLKGIFTSFCKGLGIYCNGFWGCGDLDPHKCNQKWPKSLYKRSIDSKVKDIDTSHLTWAFYPTYLIGECIDHREREESALAVLCAEALKKRKRETMKECAVGTL